MPSAATQRSPEDYANRALRLSPFDTHVYFAYQAMGLGRVSTQQFDEAASNFAKALHANPRFSWLCAEHAATLALSGRIEESKAVARRLLELEPNFHIRPVMEFLSFMRPEFMRTLTAGLIKAGLPEWRSLVIIAYSLRAPFGSAQIARNASPSDGFDPRRRSNRPERPLFACAVRRRRFPKPSPTRRNAPAGSNRSSHGGDKMAEAFGVAGHV